jgi:hypothetical protein
MPWAQDEQCVEQEEENRETQLHAHESGETWMVIDRNCGRGAAIVSISTARRTPVHPIENRSSRRKAKTHPLQKTAQDAAPRTSTASTQEKCNFKPEAKGQAPARMRQT